MIGWTCHQRGDTVQPVTVVSELGLCSQTTSLLGPGERKGGGWGRGGGRERGEGERGRGGEGRERGVLTGHHFLSQIPCPRTPSSVLQIPGLDQLLITHI